MSYGAARCKRQVELSSLLEYAMLFRGPKRRRFGFTYGGVGRRGWCRHLRIWRGWFQQGRRAEMLHV